MPKSIRPTEAINDKTSLTECKDGFWLYDKNRGMNLAMRAKSEKEALVQALEYYQGRLIEVEAKNNKLMANAYTFLEGLGIDEEIDI